MLSTVFNGEDKYRNCHNNIWTTFINIFYDVGKNGHLCNDAILTYRDIPFMMLTCNNSSSSNL